MIGWGTILAIAFALVLLAVRRILAVRAQLRDGACTVAAVDSARLRGRWVDIEFRYQLEGDERTGQSSLPKSDPDARRLCARELQTVAVVHRDRGGRPLVVTARDFAPAPRPSGSRG